MAAEPNEHDDWAQRFASAYREAPIESAEARDRLTAALRTLPPPRERRWTPRWWVARASFRSRPLVLAGAALALLVAGVGIGMLATRSARVARPGTQTAPVPIAENAGSPEMARATFAFQAPGASRVALVGDFNRWDPAATPLHRASVGDLWIGEVPLTPGLHVYAFVVDNSEWIPDPSAPRAPVTAFGTRASVVFVGDSNSL